MSERIDALPGPGSDRRESAAVALGVVLMGVGALGQLFGLYRELVAGALPSLPFALSLATFSAGTAVLAWTTVTRNRTGA